MLNMKCWMIVLIVIVGSGGVWWLFDSKPIGSAHRSFITPEREEALNKKEFNGYRYGAGDF